MHPAENANNEPSNGKLWVHAVLLVTTAGIGDLLYWWWSRRTSTSTGRSHGGRTIAGIATAPTDQVLHDTRPIIIWPFKSLTTRYIVTEHRVVLAKGLVNKRTIDFQARDIRQISTGATWFERLRGYGHIEVEAHDGAVITFKAVSNYKQVANSIRRVQSSS